MIYKKIYYSEKLQKVKRTSESLESFDGFEYIGTMTETEFLILLEIFLYKFGDKDIVLTEFQKIFGDLKTCISKLKQ